MTKRKAGRPEGSDSFKPTPEQRQQVEQLAGFGIPQEDMVRLILNSKGQPISQVTLRKHFRNELDVGMTKANIAVAGALFRNAVKEMNVTAQIFWCKTRLRWVAPEDMPPAPPTSGEQDMLELARQVALVLYLGRQAKEKQGNIIEHRA